MNGIVIGVIGALAVAAVGAALKWGKALLAAIARRVRPDHAALGARPAWALIASGVSGNRSAIRVLAACAPSRSLRPANIDPDLAIPFIRDSFPGMFPDEPAVSLPRHGVKFTVSPDGSTSDGFAWAWTSGRVDLSAVIGLEPRPDGRFVIPVLEILRPITLLAEAVSTPAYSRVYRKTRTRLPRRFDWFIAVSTDLVRPGDGATVPWDDLEFPGRRPQRAGASQYPSCPPTGYASARLRNWSPRRPIAELLAAFLDDFLKQNGYHAVDQAIADTIDATTAAEIATPIAPGALAAPSSPDPESTGPSDLSCGAASAYPMRLASVLAAGGEQRLQLGRPDYLKAPGRADRPDAWRRHPYRGPRNPSRSAVRVLWPVLLHASLCSARAPSVGKPARRADAPDMHGLNRHRQISTANDRTADPSRQDAEAQLTQCDCLCIDPPPSGDADPDTASTLRPEQRTSQRNMTG